MLVVVQGAVVDHVARPGPGVGQQVLHEVLPLGEVPHGSVLQHAPALVVAVHGPHLREEQRGREELSPREEHRDAANRRNTREQTGRNGFSRARVLQGPNLGCFSGLVFTEVSREKTLTFNVSFFSMFY